jgi:formate dehydrogenase subunit gamma
VALTEYIKKRLAVDFHGTTANRSVTLEPVYCLGNCACSPAVMVDGEVYVRVTVDRFEEILNESEARG